MSTRIEKLTEILPCGVAIGGMCVALGSERPKVNRLCVYHDPGKIPSGGLGEGSSFQTASEIVPLTPVSLVLLACRLPQVDPSIVGSMSIPVVNFRRFIPGNKFPDDTMGRPWSDANKVYHQVARRQMHSTSGGPSETIVYTLTDAINVSWRYMFEMGTWPATPNQGANVRIINEALAQVSLIWQCLNSPHVPLPDWRLESAPTWQGKRRLGLSINIGGS